MSETGTPQDKPQDAGRQSTPLRTPPPAGQPSGQPAGQHLAFGIAMLLVLLGGLVLSVLNPAVLPDDSARRRYGSVRSGDWMSAYQAEYEQESPLREFGVRFWGSIRYGLFGEGLPGVVVGQAGVLFTAEEFQVRAGLQAEAEQVRRVLRYVAEVRDSLGRHGAELVVVPVPAKARVYREYLGRYGFPPEAEQRYREFVFGLAEIGVSAPDLAAAMEAACEHGSTLGPAVFLRTDTHWSPAGAKLAAELTAGLVRDGAYLLNAAEQSYHLELHPKELHPYRGDLVSFIPLGPFRGLLEPAPDYIPRFELQRGPARGLGLFETAPVPVVLVGTSYSAGEVWGFHAFLQNELQSEVLNLAEEGRGPFQPMARYLAGATLREAPPRLVIWEIPERYLPYAELPDILGQPSTGSP